MAIVITLKDYFKQLKNDGCKPPTIKELARSINMDVNTLSNISNNKVRQLSLETGGKIINEMRRRGFDMQISDLIKEG